MPVDPRQSIYRLPSTDADHIKRIRCIVAESRETLEQPAPDTFLGRKTQEPFPEENS